ncbi:MAG: hypothetical protein IJ518_00160 [Clostridia bacterium]|nr:hypothetical protein [Clostridia bacterium]
MKKLLLCVWCLVLLAVSLPVYAVEPATVTTTASATAVKAGDEVTFTIHVTGVEKSSSMALQPGKGFDSRVFEFVSGKWLIQGALADVDTAKLNAVIGFQKAMALEGEVFTFTLRVKATAPGGATTVKVPAVIDGEDTVYLVGCTMTVAGTQTPAVTTTEASSGQNTTARGTTTARPANTDSVFGTTMTNGTVTGQPVGTAAQSTPLGGVTETTQPAAGGTTEQLTASSTSVKADTFTDKTESENVARPFVDTSDLWMWIVIAGVALAVAAVCVIVGLRRKG